MTSEPELNRTQPARRTAHAPRPLPVWWQVGVALLLLWNGLQAVIHHNGPSSSPTADQPAPSINQERFAYTYQPDNLRATGNMHPTFQYSPFFDHATGGAEVVV